MFRVTDREMGCVLTANFDSWLILDLLLVDLTSYKQVSKWRGDFMQNGENMDNFTALYTWLVLYCWYKLDTCWPLMLMVFSFSSQLSSINLCCPSSGSKTVRVNRSPTVLSKCVSQTLRNSTLNDFSWTNMFTCILKVQF